MGKGKESSGGMLRVYSVSDVATIPVIKLAEHNDAKQWVSDVKFSADGGTIAIGTFVKSTALNVILSVDTSLRLFTSIF